MPYRRICGASQPRTRDKVIKSHYVSHHYRKYLSTVVSECFMHHFNRSLPRPNNTNSIISAITAKVTGGRFLSTPHKTRPLVTIAWWNHPVPFRTRK